MLGIVWIIAILSQITASCTTLNVSDAGICTEDSPVDSDCINVEDED